MPRWIWPGLLMGVGFCSVGARFFLRWDLASLPPGAKTAITARRGVLICWCYGERTEDFLLLFSLHLSSPGFLRACSTWFLSGRLGAGSLDLFLVLVISHRVMILRCRFLLILRRAWPLWLLLAWVNLWRIYIHIICDDLNDSLLEAGCNVLVIELLVE